MSVTKKRLERNKYDVTPSVAGVRKPSVAGCFIQKTCYYAFTDFIMAAGAPSIFYSYYPFIFPILSLSIT